MKIELYYAPITCAMAPYITLTEAGAAFESVPVNMRREQHKAPDFLKLNPKHKVPVLVVDGKVLTESTAIQLWIARNFPDANLLPADPWDALQAVSLMSWCASGFHPFLARINSPPKVCDLADADEPVRRLAAEQLYENFGIAEERLAGKPFFFDQFTAPDAYFFWAYRRAEQFKLDLAPYRHCAAHHAGLKERPSVAKLLAYEQETMAAFAKAA